LTRQLQEPTPDPRRAGEPARLDEARQVSSVVSATGGP